MTLRLLGLLLAASLVPTMHCTPREEKRSIHVAVAMSLLPAIQDAAELFEQRNPNIDVLLNGGASGLLLQQTLRGAPTDLFVSASPAELDRLADEDRIVSGSRSTIATNRIVILVARGSPVPDDPRDLLGPDYPRVAIGNPAQDISPILVTECIRKHGFDSAPILLQPVIRRRRAAAATPANPTPDTRISPQPMPVSASSSSSTVAVAVG